jgi:hypothetical protein
VSGIVELDEADARRCAYLLASLARERRLAGVPVPPEVDALQRRIEQAASRPRRPLAVNTQPARQLPHGEIVGTRWAAQRLGWTTRRVQRHAKRLGGVMTGAGYVFSRNAIDTTAEQQERN